MSDSSLTLKSRLLWTFAGVACIVVACTDSAPPGPSTGAGGSAGSAGDGSTSGGKPSGAGTTMTNGGTCAGGSCSTGGTAGVDGDPPMTGGAGEGGAESALGGTAGSGGGGGARAGSGGVGGTAGSGGSGGAVCEAPNRYADLSQLLLDGARSLEAEGGELSGAAALVSVGTGYSGAGFVDMMGSEGAIEWGVSVPSTATYTLTWTSCSDEERAMVLDVSCVADPDPVVFATTGAWNSAWKSITTRQVRLVKGLNRIRLSTNGASGPNIDKLTIAPPSCELGADGGATCEGEDALLSGAAGVRTEGSGWSGSGFADMNGSEGAINWFLDAPRAGRYSLTFTYAQDAAVSGARDMTLKVNGASVAASLAFNDTQSWSTGWASDVTVDVDLLEGLNVVRLATNGGSGPNFDKVVVATADDGAGGAGGAGVGLGGAAGASSLP